ncbi:MAG: DUF975 family protein [Eubacteriales bacterium]|nr:DUF975 family protein [Eubacteriales bacterium]
MLLARDFREIARENLAGRWPLAIGTCLVGSLLGAAMNVSIDASSFSSSTQYRELAENIRTNESLTAALPVLMTVGIAAIVWLLICAVIGGAVTLGYAQFFLHMTDGAEAGFGDLFSQMRRLWEGFCMQFFRGVMVMAWSFLFVIPGIIAMYRYSMTPYIMLEHPDLSVMEAISESKRIMMGNKWRLFCLEMSFIGWILLGMITCGIASLWANPYIEAARTAFYREITEQRYSRPHTVSLEK